MTPVISQGSRVVAALEAQRWLEEGGPSQTDKHSLIWISPKVMLAGHDSNVGLFTTERIESGDMIMAIAKSAAFNARSHLLDNDRRASAERKASALREVCNWQTQLVDASDQGRLETIVALTQELIDADTSPWWPYLRTLPNVADATVPSLWASVLGDEASCSPLSGTSYGAAINADIQDIEHLHSDNIDMASLFGVEDGRKAVNHFLHAIALVSTRLFTGIGMLPLADMMNGASRGMHNVTMTSSVLPGMQHLECVAFTAVRSIDTDQEIVLEYGHLSTSDFLYRYGYIPDSTTTENPDMPTADAVTLDVTPIWTSLADLQRDALAPLGINQQSVDSARVFPKSNPLILALSSGTPSGGFGLMGIPLALRQLAFVACCSNQALQTIIATGNFEIPREQLMEVVKVIATWCDAQAASISSLPIDISAQDSSKMRMAARVREIERQGLAAWSSHLRSLSISSDDSDLAFCQLYRTRIHNDPRFRKEKNEILV